MTLGAGVDLEETQKHGGFNPNPRASAILETAQPTLVVYLDPQELTLCLALYVFGEY